MTDAEYQRNVFWELMEKKLKEQGVPFLIKPRYNKGTPNYTADIFKGDKVDLIINFLYQEGILRIALYIYDAVEIYEYYRENCSKIEEFLNFKVEFVSGVKSKDIKWIKREWTFTPNHYEDYERVLKQAIPEMKRFIEVFKGYFK